MAKNLPTNAGDIRGTRSIPGSGRFSGEGHGNPLQYSYMENPMDRTAWHFTVHRDIKSWTRLKRLCMHAFSYSSGTQRSKVRYEGVFKIKALPGLPSSGGFLHFSSFLRLQNSWALGHIPADQPLSSHSLLTLTVTLPTYIA